MNWFSRNKWERDMSEELRFHIDQQIAANIVSGMPAGEARPQARLQLGPSRRAMNNPVRGWHPECSSATRASCGRVSFTICRPPLFRRSALASAA